MIESWILLAFINGRTVGPIPQIEFPTRQECLDAGEQITAARSSELDARFICIYQRSPAADAIKIVGALHTRSSSSAGATPPYHANSSQIG
jgi:hypothetical protein